MVGALLVLALVVQSHGLLTFISGYSSNITSWQFGSTGALSYKNSSNGLTNPSWMAWNSNKKYMYAVNEIGNKGGMVVAFTIDYTNSKLKFINSVSSGGGSPCYIAVHRSDQWVFVANYDDGFVSVLPVLRGGGIGSAVYNQRSGNLAHMTVSDKSGKYLFVPFKGSDYIAQFVFDSSNGALTPNPTSPFARVAAGSGPRHLVFHPSEQWAFAVTELASTAITFSYNRNSGTLTPLFTVSCLPKNWTGTSTGAEILITPDGKFVYASNRGHDSIAIFKVEQNGKLTTVGWERAGGSLVTPRGVSMSPSGSHLLVASQGLNTVTTFAINQQDGTLRKVMGVGVPTQPSYIGILP